MRNLVQVLAPLRELLGEIFIAPSHPRSDDGSVTSQTRMIVVWERPEFLFQEAAKSHRLPAADFISCQTAFIGHLERARRETMMYWPKPVSI
ncbi:hypothetical protein WT05_12045 [Burkholderia stagnalis]|nr:hypothetical protein WT05_12045 [Burkholderia stagnalis]